MRNLREYVCEHCGGVFLSRDKYARYCTRRCYQQERFKGRKKVDPKPKDDSLQDRTCPHNEYVVCPERKCDRCGWNPKVANARMARYKRVRGIREVAEHG